MYYEFGSSLGNTNKNTLIVKKTFGSNSKIMKFEKYPGSYGQNQKIESIFKSSRKSQTHDISISVGNIY